MMHAFPRTFTLPKHRLERVIDAGSAPLKPAVYLRLRREAAGLSIATLARRLARNADEIAPALDLVHVMETPGNTIRYPETLERLRSVFAFDPDVYRQLATEPADRHPRICRGCGWSTWDSCDDGGNGSRRWATPTACTACLLDTDAEGLVQ
jgi:hypothetical protein